MKTRRFLEQPTLLVAFGLITLVAAEALAQFGGPTRATAYAEGYKSGFSKGCSAARSGTWLGGYNTLRDRYKKPDAYERGIIEGYKAAQGCNGSTVNINGVDLGDPANLIPAAINYQQAYQRERRTERIEDFENRQQLKAMYHVPRPHASPEELAALAHVRSPAPLTEEEFDPAQGVIKWPEALNRPEFDDNRAKLDDLFREAADDPHGSGPGTQNYRDTEQAVDELNDKLRSEIAQFETNEYIAASKFLKRLLHHARAPGAQAPDK